MSYQKQDSSTAGLIKTNPLAIHCASVCGKQTVCLIPIENAKTTGAIETFLDYMGADVCITCRAVVAIVIQERNKEKQAKADIAAKAKADAEAKARAEEEAEAWAEVEEQEKASDAAKAESKKKRTKSRKKQNAETD